MRFTVQKFNRHIANMGQQLLWRPSYACSCVSADSGSADPTCRLCMKKGRIWTDPVPAFCGLTSQKTQAQWAAMGMWEAGDVVVTIPEDSPMWDSAGQYDRVTLLNATDRFSMALRRGAPNESLARFSVASIDRVFWRHPTTQQAVEGGIPTVAEDGTLSWSTGEPPPGATYSITGMKHIDYFFWGDFPANRNMHGGYRLPKRVVLRRWDLLGRG